MKWIVLLLLLAAGADQVAVPATKTKPDSWSTEGAFKVKWGMGPGDVRALYPDMDLTESKDFAHCPEHNHWAKTQIEHLTVEVLFSFYKGRLFEIQVDRPSTVGLQSSDPMWIKWHSSVLDVLTAKYGPPQDRVGFGKNERYKFWKVGKRTEIFLRELPQIRYLDATVADQAHKESNECVKASLDEETREEREKL